MCPIVPTFTCGLLRSNFSLAMSFRPRLRLYRTRRRMRSAVHLATLLGYSLAGHRSGPPSPFGLRRDSLRLLACRDDARRQRAKAGADDQNRTGDLVLTKDALCQLSYIGLRASLRQ